MTVADGPRVTESRQAFVTAGRMNPGMVTKVTSQANRLVARFGHLGVTDVPSRGRPFATRKRPIPVECADPRLSGARDRARRELRERDMDLGIAGKHAIVCASSRGLGRGCAFALA